MDNRLKNSFLKVFRENKRNRIENDGCVAWNEILTELPFFDGKQPRISVVFSRYQGHTTNMTIVKSILENGMNAGEEQIIGMVLAIPSYWLEVDEYLALNHIESFIDSFITENFDTSGSGSGSGSGSDCPVCPDNCPNNPPSYNPVPPCPPPPPYSNMPSPFLQPVQKPVDSNISEFNKP